MTASPLRRLLTIGFLAAMVLLVLAPLGGPLRLTVVVGESMLPTYEDGDLVVTWAEASPEPGDIVVFDIGRADVIHRVVGPAPGGGFITQGDNNDFLDPWHTPVEQMHGRVIGWVPALGGLILGAQRLLGDAAPWSVVAWGLWLLVRTVGPLAPRPAPAEA